MKNNNFLIDCDDTIINMCQVWLEVYNADHNDHLTKEDITDWNIGKFTKIGVKFYDYLYTMNLYWAAQPIKDSLKGVEFLRSLGYNIIYATVEDPLNYKQKWLLENGFLVNKQTYIVSPNKTYINADYILDDNYIGQIIPFYNLNKKSYLFSQPWNLKYDYKYRVDSWQDFIDKVTDKRIVL